MSQEGISTDELTMESGANAGNSLFEPQRIVNIFAAKAGAKSNSEDQPTLQILPPLQKKTRWDAKSPESASTFNKPLEDTSVTIPGLSSNVFVVQPSRNMQAAAPPPSQQRLFPGNSFVSSSTPSNNLFNAPISTAPRRREPKEFSTFTDRHDQTLHIYFHPILHPNHPVDPHTPTSASFPTRGIRCQPAICRLEQASGIQ
ncbi:hypothetical protein BDZ45DRAFT_749136 [Acephala macrosclerotiorum]|nr:hypothetical protein BDZ45DRAFT_749136 [Acephala macrosclerotiorum]